MTVRLRRRRRVCACCGQTGQRLVVHDRRVKRWRHLDLGSTRCIIECELRLLRCPDCRVVRAEPVPWARPGTHHTRDFEDVVAWLAQQMAKTPIAGLLRIGWDTVGRIVEPVVADHLDERRLDGLIAVGVDEISCAPRRHQSGWDERPMKLPERERERIRLAYWRALDEATDEGDGRRRARALIGELDGAGYASAAACLADDSTRWSSTCATRCVTAGGGGAPTCSSARSARSAGGPR